MTRSPIELFWTAKNSQKTRQIFFVGKKDQTGGGSEYLNLNIVSVRLTFIQIPETLNGLVKYLDMLDKTTHQLRIINGYWVVFDNVIFFLIASVVSQGHFRISDD